MDQGNAEEVEDDTEGQAGPQAHARAALVSPVDGHDPAGVGAQPREVGGLGVEDDAAELLNCKQIMRGGAPEALEATLRVGHGAGYPERGQRVEDPAEQTAVQWLRRAPVAAVR